MPETLIHLTVAQHVTLLNTYNLHASSFLNTFKPYYLNASNFSRAVKAVEVAAPPSMEITLALLMHFLMRTAFSSQQPHMLASKRVDHICMGWARTT